jgi:hypothetical protein
MTAAIFVVAFTPKLLPSAPVAQQTVSGRSRPMKKSSFLAPKPDELVSAIGQAGVILTPQAMNVLRARLDSLLFQRPHWWGAWQASAMTGRELRDAVLQHAHLAVEKIAERKVSAERFICLQRPFELALFGEPLFGDEPASYESPVR